MWYRKYVSVKANQEDHRMCDIMLIAIVHAAGVDVDDAVMDVDDDAL